MYTEMKKIIEAGLNGDREKVSRYTTLLIKNLEKDGDTQFANQIRSILESKKGGLVSLDNISAKPVDAESRVGIVDVSYPSKSEKQIVLNKYTKNEINCFIESYKKRDELLKKGIESPNTLLLYGSPGCGKNTIAEYISSITNLPLVTSRLDGLVSSLLGNTSKNIRKIFEYTTGKECILFLDEFDAIAKIRDDKNEMGELKRVVNSLLQNIDNFDNNNILIAATNHYHLLDPAIRRRFSTVISVDLPGVEEINQMIHLSLENPEISMSDKQINSLSEAFQGFSHSAIKTTLDNSIRHMILQEKHELKSHDVLKEIYLYENHTIENENDFISYLLKNKISIVEINKNFEFPLRKIRHLSKKMKEEA
ncbi:ATP-dependent zinc metalloprotease FtsH [Methanimicrococcus stummii]|uniref:ATP-dependent zinc metalloprotease FtsH n=1 Tax=Methanimicrococcus stummii TaxID=3028294 RepID=A0AA96V9N3_9EURY|nr:AAA family ATPase [Methanimicrococcus sp. Es2]WNY29322.1 ATP-dependent zinc metalloprotease FtsH [Methanimicrococcus sp. Es2]